MPKFTVTGGVAEFGPGHVFKPTPEQLDARRHVLREVENRKGWYEPTGMIEFKAGETLVFGREAPKGIGHLLVDGKGNAVEGGSAQADPS